MWAFRCKHYRQWGLADTRETIAACTYPAARKFLLVTRPVSEECFEEVARHPDWTLWDARDVSRHFLACLPAAEVVRLLHLHFGPGWAERLLGLPGHGPLTSAGARFASSRAAGSEGFAARHPDVTRRFLSDRPGGFGPALATLALRLSTAPEPENPFVRRSEFNSSAHVLDALPGLLKPLAERNPEHFGACLDLLWPLGRDRPQPASGTRNHPITVLGEIASFQPWKDVRVPQEVLAWAERLTRGNDWVSRPCRMGWLLSGMLGPSLATSMTETWQSGGTVS